MKNRSGTMWIMAILFGIAAVIFYFVSIKEVKTGYATFTVANIQGTVFCAGCAVMCIVNAVGAMIASSLEELHASQSLPVKQNPSHLYSLDPYEKSDADNESITEQDPETVNDSGVLQFDPAWNTDDSFWVKCPSCGERMPRNSLEYMDYKCSTCGKSALKKQ